MILTESESDELINFLTALSYQSNGYSDINFEYQHYCLIRRYLCDIERTPELDLQELYVTLLCNE